MLERAHHCERLGLSFLVSGGAHRMFAMVMMGYVRGGEFAVMVGGPRQNRGGRAIR